jgi:hypothetical protein
MGCILVESDNVVDAAQSAQNLNAILQGIDGPVGTFQALHALIRIDANDENVAIFFRLVQVSYMTAVENVKAPVCEDHFETLVPVSCDAGCQQKGIGEDLFFSGKISEQFFHKTGGCAVLLHDDGCCCGGNFGGGWSRSAGCQGQGEGSYESVASARGSDIRGWAGVGAVQRAVAFKNQGAIPIKGYRSDLGVGDFQDAVAVANDLIDAAVKIVELG